MKPFVIKQRDRFEDGFYTCAKLCSGAIDDMVPQHVVRVAGNKVAFQAPGGKSILVDVVTAIKWSQAILDICQTALTEEDTL